MTSADISPLRPPAELVEIPATWWGETTISSSVCWACPPNTVLGSAASSKQDIQLFPVYLCKHWLAGFLFVCFQQFYLCYSSVNQALHIHFTVGCGHRPWPAARRGRRWLTPLQLSLLCLTEIFKQITAWNYETNEGIPKKYITAISVHAK